MTPTLRERLAERSVAGRYDMFLAIGAGSAILGLILFVRALLAGPAMADRAWHLFHVNWIYFTGLSAGGVAFAAVQKITNAKWSGMIIRFAEALVAFLPVSLIGLVLIFTAGIRLDLRPDAERPARDAALEGGMALPRFHVRPAGAGPARAHHFGLEAGLGRHETRYVCRAALRDGGAAVPL